MEESRKPCGIYHPLPCGLDMHCHIPADYIVGWDDDLTYAYYMSGELE